MNRRARHVLLTAALAGLAVTAAPAAAFGPPANGGATPGSPSNAGAFTVTWTPADADPVIFQGGLTADPNGTPTDIVNSGIVVAPPTDGVWYFRAQALSDPGGTPSGYVTVAAITVDRTGPGATGAIPAPGSLTGVGGWYRAPLAFAFENCIDAGGNGCPNRAWTTLGFNPPGTVSLAPLDGLGNEGAPAPIAAGFGYDPTLPLAGANGAPVGPGVLVAGQPTFEWTAGVDGGAALTASGIASYEVHARTVEQGADDPLFFNVVATATDDARVGNYTAAIQSGGPLPVNTDLEWRVRAIDRAGNVRNSAWRDLRIDPTILGAPTITGGPNAPTRDPSPTFTWDGPGPTFQWTLSIVGQQTPVRQGSTGAGTQVTLASLPDNDYIFSVRRVSAANQPGEEATRSFKVDTTPPGAPVITARPTLPAIGLSPVYSWDTEPGAYSRWEVLTSAGAPVYGPIDTPLTTATLPPLAEGAYLFQVAQIDAAGNISGTTSEAFSVLAPLAAPTPAQRARAALLAALPKQNAQRLTPKAGKTLPTLRPLLKWKKGPRGTRLYNLQIFRVTSKKGSKRPRVTKVISRFPKGTNYRVPKSLLKPGTCYVWRVWPYTGRAFTARPVGVSNFCVAGQKVLRAKAAAAAAKAKAK